MRTAKKIGFVAFIISEIIICLFALITIYKVSKDKAGIKDMDTILYAQAGVLTVVWGAQGLVNFAKNKNGVKHETDI